VLPISDSSMQTIEYALGALQSRSEVVANNLANAEVPGFSASRVPFEAQLRKAVDTGTVSRLGAPGPQVVAGIPAANGNSVDVSTELVQMIETDLLRQAMVEAFSFKTGLLRTAIRGQ